MVKNRKNYENITKIAKLSIHLTVSIYTIKSYSLHKITIHTRNFHPLRRLIIYLLRVDQKTQCYFLDILYIY